MMKKKRQLSTSTKSKMVDFFSFCMIVGGLLAIVVVLRPYQVDWITILALIFLIVPTVAALIVGAPFVPTPMRACRKMIKLAKINEGDNVVDIGCGDGRLAYLAANEHQANAVGYELSPLVWLLAKVRQLFWKSKARIVFGDFRMHDLSKTDCIVCYMLPETLKKFIPKFEKEMKKGAKIISYAFKIGDWLPVHVEPIEAEKNISKIWVYEIGKQYEK